MEVFWQIKGCYQWNCEKSIYVDISIMNVNVWFETSVGTR